jgi:hypothetical protein
MHGYKGEMYGYRHLGEIIEADGYYYQHGEINQGIIVIA